MTDSMVYLFARGRLATFDGVTLGAAYVDASYVPAATDPTVGDITGEIVGAGYARQTFDAEWDANAGALTIKVADQWPTFDTTGAEPAGAVLYVDGGPDDGKLVTYHGWTPYLGSAGDELILEQIALATDGASLDERVTALEGATVAVTSVAGVSPVDGDVDAQDLADALAPLIGGGGGGGEPGPWIADDSGLRYRVDRGLVQLGGDVSDWSLASSWEVCTLPPECRPVSTRAWYVVGDDDGSMAIVEFTVEATGVLTAAKRYGAPVDSVWASLVGCSFALADPEEAMTMRPVAPIYVGGVDVELIPGQEWPRIFRWQDEAGEPVPVPAGTWTCHYSTALGSSVAMTVDGSDLVLTIPADEVTRLFAAALDYRIRLDGQDVLGGRFIIAKPRTSPPTDPIPVVVGEAAAGIVQVIAPAIDAGASGTSDHRDLTDRDAADQHPIGSVTGLTSALSGKEPTGTAAGLISALTPADIGAVADDDERLDDARTPLAHTHAQADVTGLSTTLAAKADLVGGVVPTSQIPALATVEVYTVEDEDEMLALVCQRGDVAIRLDEEQAYILAGDDPSDLGDWAVLPSPSAPVTTVNGQIGTVVLGATDVGAAATSHTHTSGQVSGLATVATTGAYADLSGRPTIPSTAAAVGAVAAGTGAARIEAVTQDDYDLLTPVATTLYVIVED